MGKPKTRTIIEIAKFIACKIKLRRREYIIFAVVLCTSGLLSLFFLPESGFLWKQYRVGDITRSLIKATHDFKVVDRMATFRMKERASLTVPDIYNYDEEIAVLIKSNIRNIFSICREIAEKQENHNSKSAIKLYTQVFMDKLGFEPSESAVRFLAAKNFSIDLQAYILKAIDKLYEEYFVIGGVQLSSSSINRSNTFVTVHFSDGRRITVSVGKVLTIDEAKNRVKRELGRVIGGQPEKRSVATFIESLLLPNLYFDQIKTITRKKEVYRNTLPIYQLVRKGEVIAREGEVIHSEQLDKIRKNSLVSKKPILPYFIGLVLFFYVVLVRGFKIVPLLGLQRAWNTKDVFFLCTLLVFILGLSGGIKWIGMEIAKTPVSGFELFLVATAVPLGLGLMLVRAIFDIREAVVFHIIFSLLVGWFLMPSLYVMSFTFLIGTVVLFGFSQVENRSSFLKVGVGISLLGMFTVIVIAMIEGFPGSGTVSWSHLGLGMLTVNAGALLTPVLALGLLPLIEYVFGYTTTLTLLELSSMEHPLLKSLVILAPGTYSHSMLISTLTDRAAKEIGANALLVRVGAYFHDIGKMKKPGYFIENLKPGEGNKHDNLTPSMSALIIKSHVKEGIELARSYKLPEIIIDMIPEHHGTTLIQYFYEKVKLSDPNVEENDFRYVGPKPRSREAGFLMLADSVEASSRILPEYSIGRIQGLVQQTIRTKFLDGQLDECHITLKDLHAIARSFMQTLTGVYHHRISYENVKDKTQKIKSGTQFGKSVVASKKKLAASSKKDAIPLKRLGL